MRALAVLVLATSLQFHAVPAAAGERRECVSVQEFETAPFARKRVVEAFWDAPGTRTDVVEPGSPRLVAFEYEACGRGWVVVVYRRTSRVAQQFWAWTPDEKRARS